MAAIDLDAQLDKLGKSIDERMAQMDELGEVLADLVELDCEREALTGGGPGFGERWRKAIMRASELTHPDGQRKW